MNFYPLCDVDKNGTMKKAVYLSEAEETLKEFYSFYLKELDKGLYELVSSGNEKPNSKWLIECPVCNTHFLERERTTENVSLISIYFCPFCH